MAMDNTDFARGALRDEECALCKFMACPLTKIDLTARKQGPGICMGLMFETLSPHGINEVCTNAHHWLLLDEVRADSWHPNDALQKAHSRGEQRDLAQERGGLGMFTPAQSPETVSQRDHIVHPDLGTWKNFWSSPSDIA